MSTNHNFWRERRTEAVSNRGPSAYQPTALPLSQTGSLFGIGLSLSLICQPTSEDLKQHNRTEPPREDWPHNPRISDVVTQCLEFPMASVSDWFTTSFLQPLPYLVTPQGPENCQLTSSVLLELWKYYVCYKQLKENKASFISAN